MVKIAKIHIIGGGIAGLASGYFAHKRFPFAEIHIYEASKNIGGRCQTFYSSKLDIELDNATHVILGGNKYARQFLRNIEFIRYPYFCDMNNQKVDAKRFLHSELILRSIFNSDAKSVDWGSKLNLCTKLFPYFSSQLKIFYSQHNLQQKLISPLSCPEVNIHNNMLLRGFRVTAGNITSLIFKRGEVDVATNDIVISALDAHNYHKIFGGAEFDYNRIVNIFYRTSQKLALPSNANMLGIENADFDWLFATDNTIGVTISNVDKQKCCDEAWAIDIWKQICRIRNVKAAFVPAFQILDYPRATIAQDKINNQKRPQSAKGPYANLLIAGDWTMKNWPCCIESAIVSATRAINSI